jgi:NADH-ubiquinone oxidoreductase chain 1
VLIFISVIFLVIGYNFIIFFFLQEYIWLLIFVFPLRVIWLGTSLAETNRTPFDFAEGESELVSGFNVEYRRGGFALIFLAEYARILFMRFIFTMVFLGANFFYFNFFLKLSILSFLFI